MNWRMLVILIMVIGLLPAQLRADTMVPYTKAKKTLMAALGLGGIAALYLLCSKIIVPRYHNDIQRRRNQALLDAVRANDSYRVRVALELGAAVEACDIHGNTVLIRAISEGYPKIVQILLQAGANPNQVTSAGLAPLHIATARASLGNRYKVIAQLLVQYGADINMQDTMYGTTPLIASLIERESSLAHWLLDKGANPKLKADLDEDGVIPERYYPVNLATDMQDCGLVRRMIGMGVNINRRGYMSLETPIYTAVDHNNHELIALLLAHGANLHKTAIDRSTAFGNAIKNKNTALIGQLLPN